MTVEIPRLYRWTLSALMLSVLLMAGMNWYVLFPRVRLTIKAPLPIVGTTAIHAGDTIEVVVDYCSSGEAFGWVGGVFASRGVIYPVVGVWPATLPDGCHVVRQRIPTPATLPPGSYRFYMVRDYAPTIIASVQRHVESEPFEILASGTGNIHDATRMLTSSWCLVIRTARGAEPTHARSTGLTCARRGARVARANCHAEAR